jgi:2',3'-cyclic-nucleotide 2'-phosphodiesterase (5'-nucleotidase family)
MSAVLVYSEIELTKSQPESALSNFFSDAITSTCKSKNIIFDFALPSTNGGIRTSLPKGAITRRHAFELMPFENELVVLTLKAESVEKLVQYIVDKGGQPVSDIQITANKSEKPVFKIAGKEFVNSGYYKVLTSDYLANGGDGIDAFKEAVKKENTNIKVRDAIIDYMISENKSGKTLNPQKDGRIIIEQ